MDYQTARTPPTPEQIGQVRDAAVAATMLPHVEEEVDSMIKGVIARATQALVQGTLTPEGALEAWRELAMAKRILKNFQTRITVGNAVAEEIAPALNLGDSNGR